MATEFKHLFTPLNIGSMTVRNRLLITAHATLFCDGDSLYSERDAHYFAERARGGAGLIIMGGPNVHWTSTGKRLYPIGYKKEVIPRYRMMAGMVHEHGGRIFAQLRHRGQFTDTGVFDDFRPVWAPSPVPMAGLRENAKEMELEDIDELIEAFALAATYAQEGGLDGVELHGASGYLIQQFMSPYINKRSDEYGGDLDNRLRFAYRIIDRVRERCGREFVVGIRLSGDEFVPGGLTIADSVEIAQRLEATGQLDFIDVAGGTGHASQTLVPPMDFPQGFMVPLAAAIKQATDGIPVFTVGRIVDPVYAEKVLADGQADMVGMTRAQICDPELGNKAIAGRLDEIRQCVGCNQGCLAKNRLGRPITCIQNVAAGREKDFGFGTVQMASRTKTVMVIGGGPAGMEAARVAASRGHRVLLFEKENELGGQINLAARSRAREEFGGVARNLVRFVNNAAVEVSLGTEVTPAMVAQINPDAVIVATGSRPLRGANASARGALTPIPGMDLGHVISVFDVLKGTRDVGQHVVLIDDEGHQRASSTAEFLVDRGCDVEIISRFPTIAFELDATNDQTMYYQRLPRKGVVFHLNTAVKGISERDVTVYTTYSKVERRIADVDNVVLAIGNLPENGLYQSLKGQVQELYSIGDCVHPRRVADAIFEGNVIGRRI